MKSEADALVAAYGRPRRTVVAAEGAASRLEIEDLVEDERSLLVLSQGGYVKRMKDKTFTAQVRLWRRGAGRSRVRAVTACVRHRSAAVRARAARGSSPTTRLSAC